MTREVSVTELLAFMAAAGMLVAVLLISAWLAVAVLALAGSAWCLVNEWV